MNEQKIILDLCGGTGSWGRPYKEAGYDVRLVTLPDNDVLTYEPPDNVYGILAAPPCTEFSLAKGGLPRDFKSAMEVVEACLRIIWQCRVDGNLKFWALENPVWFLRQFLGIPKYTFMQWQFGETRVKRTDVWGYFNEPTPTVKQRPEHVSTCIGRSTHSIEWSKAETPQGYEYLNKLPYNERRAAIRAITPTGFAQAFFKANP